MHVLGSDCNRDFVFVVNLVDVWVNAWMMQHSMEKVESKVFKDHAEVYLESKHIAGRKTIAADIKSLLDRWDQINPESDGTHNHVVNQDDYRCHNQEWRSELSKYGLMTSQINELWLGIGKPIIYHSADHKMMLM